jgi:hypothetical protein
MQTTPAAAKIPNIVNLSLVAEMSFTELEILADAQDMKPADSSSCCCTVLKDPPPNQLEEAVGAAGALSGGV